MCEASKFPACKRLPQSLGLVTGGSEDAHSVRTKGSFVYRALMRKVGEFPARGRLP